MSPRFIGNLAFGGAVVAAASQAFTPSVTGWLMFGVSPGVLVFLALVQLDGARGLVQRLLDTGTGALALSSAVASVAFSGTILTWLSFADAVGFIGLAVVARVAHQLETERVVYPFDAIPAEAGDRRRGEEPQAAV
jgi:hypothetical protein